MKNLSTQIENWFDRIDNRWRRVPIKTQRLVAILFFTVYALLSLYVMAQVFFDLGRASSQSALEHMDSPDIQKRQYPDAGASTNLKN